MRRFRGREHGIGVKARHGGIVGGDKAWIGAAGLNEFRLETLR
jgi:hypothetical protein